MYDFGKSLSKCNVIINKKKKSATSFRYSQITILYLA